jgi:hypothetical protein
MASLVSQMTPNGNTNQPIGLGWAWLSLVGGGALTAPAMQSGYQYQQIIILLSDGLNTQDRWYTNQTSVNNRMINSSGAAPTSRPRHHDLRHPSEHRRRSDLNPAAELRQRLEEVLDARQREPDQHRVQLDRHQPDAVAGGQIKKPGLTGRAFSFTLRNSYATYTDS